VKKEKSKRGAPASDDPNLCVASIVITCATPMVEEPEEPFPRSSGTEDAEKGATTEPEDAKAKIAEAPSTTAESSGTPPSATETSESRAAEPSEPEPEFVSGAGLTGTVPDELEPDQLEKLQDLKESDA